MPIQFVGPALQGASMIGRFGVPVLQQAGISAGLAGLGAAAAAISNKTASSSQGARRGAAGKPRGSGFSSISSDQLPPGAYMTEAGRVYGMDSEQVSKAGGYMDEMGRVFLPNGRQVAQPTQRPPMPGLPAGYKEQELAAGAAAERFRPAAGFPGQQSAADRDYESQKRRAEQLAQQDELSKKYRVADLTKAYNTAATPEEKEKIGLEIWATTNPQLAQKLKPGQLGYEQVQSVQAAQSPLGGALQAARNIELADKTSFNAVPSAGFGVGFGANLNTQIPGVQVPANLQENIAGAFTSPVNVPSFDQTAKLFDPAKISEVDRATLVRLFNEGLQKK
jgi:hypothetical protein